MYYFIVKLFLVQKLQLHHQIPNNIKALGALYCGHHKTNFVLEKFTFKFANFTHILRIIGILTTTLNDYVIDLGRLLTQYRAKRLGVDKTVQTRRSSLVRCLPRCTFPLPSGLVIDDREDRGTLSRTKLDRGHRVGETSSFQTQTK